MKNCTNYGEVSASDYAIGGIIGGSYESNEENNVTISDCINYGNIGVKNTNNAKNHSVGGIVGRVLKGEVSSSKNYGDIDGYQYVGGIVGKSSDTVKESFNEGDITVTYVGGGGIVGHNSGNTVTKCSNKGKIYLTKNGYYAVGGIVGMNGDSKATSKVEQCFNEGEVYSLAKSSQGNSQVGGIVGHVSSNSTQPVEVISCYNKGYVHGNGYIGGIAGYTRDVILKECYSIGKLELLTGNSGIIGGIIGVKNKENNEISKNYYLNTCGANFGLGSTSSNEGAESKNESEIKSLAKILGQAYKEDTHYINDGYPILNWQE